MGSKNRCWRSKISSSIRSACVTFWTKYDPLGAYCERFRTLTQDNRGACVSRSTSDHCNSVGAKQKASSWGNEQLFRNQDRLEKSVKHNNAREIWWVAPKWIESVRPSLARLPGRLWSVKLQVDEGSRSVRSGPGDRTGRKPAPYYGRDRGGVVYFRRIWVSLSHRSGFKGCITLPARGLILHQLAYYALHH